MSKGSPLERAAGYAVAYRDRKRPVHPPASAEDLRRAFGVPLQDAPLDPSDVVDELIRAAEPGLVGNTDPNFFAWVMGGSSKVGVAADWLTSIWGQNAAIFQTSPAAATAEEAVASWVLDLLDLPRESSVGLVTGATMAGFVGLAAARTEILARRGYDLERRGIQNAPRIRVYLSDDAHASNHAALRLLGFGDDDIERLPSDRHGLMNARDLERAMRNHDGPQIVIAQAGHINTGGFEDIAAFARITRSRGAWLHVDGAFGLWARVLPEKAALTRGIELADSWSVDGHKWLQIPYDSGFAIVRHRDAHRRAMDISAGYLNSSAEDGRNPTEFNPELSRRARGFAAWAVLRSLGREGVRDLVRGHCDGAARIADRLASVPGLEVLNDVGLNQVVIAPCADRQQPDRLIDCLAGKVNEHAFVRPARWKGRNVLRISVISGGTEPPDIQDLAETISDEWSAIASHCPPAFGCSPSPK